MELITTNSFKLAVNTAGDINSRMLAIILPGRLDTKDYWNFNSHLELLARKGFYAVCFDPPGTWESLGGIELFTTTNYIKAVNELITYYGNRPTLLIGHSRGAQVAMLTSVTNPYVIGFISINGSFEPSTYPSKDKIFSGTITEYRDLPPGDKKTDIQKVFNLPINFFDDGAKYNLLGSLHLYQKPKLIIYSDDDNFTEPEEVEQIYSTLSEPKSSRKLIGAHDYRYSQNNVAEVNESIDSFLNRYFPS